MKLDRNINADGHGKYGLIKNRRLAQIRAWDGGDGEIADQLAVEEAIALLERAGVIDWGDKPDTEFFVMRLKDRCSGPALKEYAVAAVPFDQEYAKDMRSLANRSGLYHPLCKNPD